MVDSSREAFSAGKFRSEIQYAIPRLRADDIEWIVGYFVSELQASRSAAIEECAAIAEHAGDDAGYALAKKSAFGKDIADALRALKGEG